MKKISVKELNKLIAGSEEPTIIVGNARSFFVNGKLFGTEAAQKLYEENKNLRPYEPGGDNKFPIVFVDLGPQ